MPLPEEAPNSRVRARRDQLRCSALLAATPSTTSAGRPWSRARPTEEADVARQGPAGEGVAGGEVGTRPDPLLALQAAGDVGRVGADASQIAATSLMKATDVARNALSACLVISADSTPIHSIGLPNRSSTARQPGALLVRAHARDEPVRGAERLQGPPEPEVLGDAGEAQIVTPGVRHTPAEGGRASDRQLRGEDDERAAARRGAAPPPSGRGPIRRRPGPRRRPGCRMRSRSRQRPRLPRRTAVANVSRPALRMSRSSSVRPGSSTGGRSSFRPATTSGSGSTPDDGEAGLRQAGRDHHAEVPEPHHGDRGFLLSRACPHPIVRRRGDTGRRRLPSARWRRASTPAPTSRRSAR